MRATANNIKRFKAAKDTLAHYEKFNGAYFWNSPRGASARRAMEARESIDETYKLGEHELRVVVDVSCSCKNVYVDREIYLDNERLKTKVKAKKLLQ